MCEGKYGCLGTGEEEGLYRVIVLPLLPGVSLPLRPRRAHLCSLFGAPLVPPSDPLMPPLPPSLLHRLVPPTLRTSLCRCNQAITSPGPALSTSQFLPGHHSNPLCLTFVTQKCQGANPHGTIFHHWAPEANGWLRAPLVLRCVP